MDLLMKLLIKSDWRGIFDGYPVGFQQKQVCLGDCPTSSAILDKNPLFSTGSFFMGIVFCCFCNCAYTQNFNLAGLRLIAFLCNG